MSVEGLWLPGQHLDHEFPTPSEDELAGAWQTMTGRESQPMQEVFGVWCPTDRPVTAIASIDICEVLRQTSISLDHVTGMPPRVRSIYSRDSWFRKDLVGADYETSVITSSVRATMNNGLVAPMEDLYVARRLLLHWRSNGVYVTANTSTLPGCELGTIRDFTERYGLSDCFDALLLPRNHDGAGAISKARALELLANTLSVDLTQTPFFHLDDSLHHIDAFSRHFEDHTTMGLFIPTHTDNATTVTDQHCDDPADSFIKAQQFLRRQGVPV